ncbi:MAG TPA: ATP-binding protein [Fimbriimonadaceae bacterium]|jgi:nitrogen-specific signal transduction histidine kinase
MKERIEDRDLSLLFDVSRASNETKLDLYLNSILEGCARWFSASGISVFIREDDSDHFVLSAKTGADMTVPEGAHLRAGHGIAGACISTGVPMIVQDPLDNPLLVGKVQPRTDIGSAMVVPLITPESGCIGVLNVSRRIGEVEFSKHDLAQATPMARHIAMAISNARLFAGVNAAVAETRAANEKLDAIIATLGVGVIVTDAFGAVEQWNPEAEIILEQELTRGTHLHQIISKCPGEMKSSVAKALRKACSGKKFVERAHDEKTDKAWSIVSSPLPRGGATIAIQDVSNHEKAIKELDRVKRLAEIGQLTAAIAHEIRNPLTGIRSASQIVQSAPGELGEFGRIIEQEALKLNALCDDFLDFARPLTLHFEKLDLLEILQRVCSEYEKTADSAGVRLRLMMDSRASRVKGDLMRIEQVCRNLILNAIQASRNGGRVVISLQRGKLVVEDEGQGIENEVVQKLFTPFFTTKANGTGLGLSNVRKIVDAHGWQIKVSSKPGSGTRFEILFQEQKAA